MLMPSKVKFRKQHRGRRAGEASRGVAIPGHIRRAGKVWIRVFPDKPVTAKPAETRMGSGKGAPEFWVAVVKRGRILFEMGGVSEAVAREALTRGAYKLPVKTRIVTRPQAG